MVHILYAPTLRSNKTHPLRHISPSVLPSIISGRSIALPVARYLGDPGTLSTTPFEIFYSRETGEGTDRIFPYTTTTK